jgi:HlyD family secretion protein
MKKIIFIIIVIVAFLSVLYWFNRKNSISPVIFLTEKPFHTTITKKSIASGKVIPLEEVEIKPQISGIISKINVEAGQIVKKGDLIATVRVIPNIQTLNSAMGRLKTAKLQEENLKINFERSVNLLEKGVISKQEFDTAEVNFKTAEQNVKNSENDLEIIQKGFSQNTENATNTNITATISGTILDIPVKEGIQVIESNTFNAGTTIAIIADMSKMIFEGTVDEAEVSKLKSETELEISLGAVEKKKFPGQLIFIAPKGSESGGSVQFKIKAQITLDENIFIRSGYSANAEIILEKKENVLAIKESLLQFDKNGDSPFVEIKTSEQNFEKRTVELGISDGINIEILKGITLTDEIKVWNKTKEEDYKFKK